MRELFKIYLIVLSVFAISACGGGSGGSGDEKQPTSLNGSAEKGPFVIGSTVTVNELTTDGIPTNATLTTQTIDDLGNFTFTYKEDALVQLSVSGYYRNEITGELSTGILNLRSIYKVSTSASQNTHINILTHLSSGRVLQLIKDGVEVEEAISTANFEIITALNNVIPAPSIDSFSDLSIYGSETNIEGNAYLTVISTLFYQLSVNLSDTNSSNPDAELSLILNTLSSDLTDGVIDDAGIVSSLKSTIPNINPASVQKNLADIAILAGSSSTAANINLFLDSDLDGVFNEYDLDDDGDGISDIDDTSPYTPNFNIMNRVFNTPEDTDISLYFDVNSPFSDSSISYTLTVAPTSGVLIGTFPDVIYRPNTNFNGSDIVKLYVSQDDIQSDEVTLTINVSASNDAPIISGQPQTSITAYKSYNFTPVVNDVDNSGWTFSIENKPTWMEFSETTGTLSGSAENSDAGEYPNIIIKVSDGIEEDVLAPFTLVVDDTPWIPQADMPIAISDGHAAVEVNGVIYIIGGRAGNFDNVFAYYPDTNTWETRSPMPVAAHTLTAHNINGLIYVFNSYGSTGPNNHLGIYNPVTDSWTSGTPMTISRFSFTSATVNGKVYVVRGRDAFNRPYDVLNVVEEYDPVSDTWTTKSPSPAFAGKSSASVFEGKIYFVSPNLEGNSEGPGKVHIYNPSLDSWTLSNGMSSYRQLHSTAFVSGKLYAMGGTDSVTLDVVEVYDPVTEQWNTKSSMLYPRFYCSNAVVNGKIYVFGGRDSTDDLSSVEMYDPSLDN